MPQITVSSKTGYGKRIVSSLVGVIFGVVLFFGSFFVLYMNEGRVDMSEIAATATEMQSDGSSSVEDGTLVYVSGQVTSDDQISDGEFLNVGDYVVVERVVEMYSWVEETSTSTEKNIGGSETTETTYDYQKEWTQYPQDSSEFYDTTYYNPSKSVEDFLDVASVAKVGEYSVSMDAVTLPELTALSLSEDMLELTEDAELNGNYVFMGEGSLSTPEIGDVRISYNVLYSGTDVTLFGEISGTNIMSYTDEKTDTDLYRMFTGSYDAAVDQMHGEYVMMMWLMRVLGFFMMWIGMTLVLGPISTLLDVLPFLGSVSRFVIGIVTFIVASVLSIVTILISMIFHSLVAVIVAAVIVIAAAVVILRSKGDKIFKK